MAALTKDRNTKAALRGNIRSGLVAASTKLFTGALVMRNAAGYLVQGQTATGLVGVGVCQKVVDNSAGANGDLRADFELDVHQFDNSSGADEITIADIGALCYAVDDQTVAKTNGSNSRSPAGLIENVDAQGVWVRFDEQLTNIAAT